MNIFPIHESNPEVLAHAIAKYSRSSKSMPDILSEIQEKNSSQFHEKFYVEYGHASIADMAPVALGIEGVSMYAALHITDHPLWNGQERSTRYQKFDINNLYDPFYGENKQWQEVMKGLGESYEIVLDAAQKTLYKHFPKPNGMSNGQYHSKIFARSCDVARFFIPLATKTNLGQVTSARTVGQQISHLLTLVDTYRATREVYSVAVDLGSAAYQVGGGLVNDAWDWDAAGKQWNQATQSSHVPSSSPPIMFGKDFSDYLSATLDYQVGEGSYSQYWKPSTDTDILKELMGDIRGYIPKEFQSAPYYLDLETDWGTYRDLHRHRRVVHFRQNLPKKIHYPAFFTYLRETLGAGHDDYWVVNDFWQQVNERDRTKILESTNRAIDLANEIEGIDRVYCLPLGASVRYLMKLDLAELKYIMELRSRPGGHPVYRKLMHTIYNHLPSHIADLINLTPIKPEDIFAR